MDKNLDILYPNILIKQIYDFSTTKFIDEDKFSLSIKHNKAYEDHSYKRYEIIKNVFINITN